VSENILVAVLGWEKLRKGGEVPFPVVKMIYKYLDGDHIKHGRVLTSTTVPLPALVLITAAATDVMEKANGLSGILRTAAMDAVMPGWCKFLNACRTGHYVLISREEAISNSFASLGLMAAQVQSQIAGRPLPEASR
jgi:hypothetical protein